MKIYKCNNSDCNKTNTTSDDWLTIGTLEDTGGLFLINNLPNAKLTRLNNHDDIHFCSMTCLIDAFFDKNKFIKPISTNKKREQNSPINIPNYDTGGVGIHGKHTLIDKMRMTTRLRHAIIDQFDNRSKYIQSRLSDMEGWSITNFARTRNVGLKTVKEFKILCKKNSIKLKE